MKEKIAIIGSGIAGMSCAYFLAPYHEIHLLEKNDYIGGHTNTHQQNPKLAFDTGFMVFNRVTYPLLTKLFKKLNVSVDLTNMSFSIRNDRDNIEYNGSSVRNGLFAQRKNILSLRYWKFLLSVKKFNEIAYPNRHDPKLKNMTVKEFVENYNLGEDFLHWFLIPMSSAVWSTPSSKMLSFPITALINFFYNHGFTGLGTQHQWETVTGGAWQYRDKLLDATNGVVKTSQDIQSISLKKSSSNHTSEAKVLIKRNNKSEPTDRPDEELYDRVIIATHADEALRLLENPTPLQESLLSCFKYQKNVATIHNDKEVMPNLKRNWSSWNFVYKGDQEYTVYYMNSLQKLTTDINYFVNINGEPFIDQEKVIRKINYSHPVFDLAAWEAQKKLFDLNRNSKINFCGSYFGYGFHEDALRSSVELSEFLLKKKVL